MNKIKTIKDIDVVGKNVIVRADLEWPSEGCPREKAMQTIQAYLQAHQTKTVKIIGHKNKNYPNLRDDPREEANDPSLAAELAGGFDVYINEAFATSHRKHCSIDALPRLMKSLGKEVCMGLRFEQEVKILNSKFKDPKLLIIGGAKASDKAKYADDLETQGWEVLRGGLLPGVELRPDGLDVSNQSVLNFKFQISNSRVIVVAGPVGKYEQDDCIGTREIFTAIANSNAYKIAGGGDTEAALAKFDLTDKFDWISVGGGAMLEYLSSGTLVGLEAILS